MRSVAIAAQTDTATCDLGRMKLGGLAVRSAAAASVSALRNLFPLKDGDIFSREKIAKGLGNLRFAYRQLGYINSTSVP